MSGAKAKIGWKSAAALVLANMIGTGAFTTLGIQLKFINSGWAVFRAVAARRVDGAIWCIYLR